MLGVFLSALLGHFSIVVKDIIFVPLFIHMTLFWNPLILGVVGGVGGGLGELSAYLIGRGIGKLTVSEEDKKKIPDWAKKLGLLSVLLVSLTPLPDAPVLLLLGSAKFPLLTILILEVVGKIVLYVAVAWVGAFFYPIFSGALPPPWGSVLITIASIGLLFIVTWKKTRDPIFRFAFYFSRKALNFFRKKMRQ
ncbi:MAG: VTT domain-containing protein [Candidatus Geothermarchaeales archaeon]